jgi:hypothetical protein
METIIKSVEQKSFVLSEEQAKAIVAIALPADPREILVKVIEMAETGHGMQKCRPVKHTCDQVLLTPTNAGQAIHDIREYLRTVEVLSDLHYALYGPDEREGSHADA